MDLLYHGIVLYNRIILYNRTISSLVLFIFTGVIFGVFDIIYFRLALKALDIGRFSWWMCCKTEIPIKVLSLKSSNFSNFFSKSFKTLHMLRNITAAQTRVRDFHKNDALAQTNQVKYDCFFFAWHRKHKKIIFSRSKIRNKNPGHVFLDFILFFNIAVEKFGKKVIWSSWSSRKRFF